MSTSLIRNTKPTQFRQPNSPMEPIQPELINPKPETLLVATVKLLRGHLPQGQFKVDFVPGTYEAVITHYLKDGGIEFFRLKLSR